jgi:hypothetical protein
MSLSLSKFKTMARATFVAASLAASVIAMPTTALAQPKIDFGIEFGTGGGGLSFGFGTGGGGIPIGTCVYRLSRNEIRRGLRRAGFYDIVFVSFTDRRATVEAWWDDDDEEYRIRVDRCTGKVTLRQIS